MEITIVKSNTYRTHGKVNIDDDKIRVVIDMNKIDYIQFQKALSAQGIKIKE